MGMFDYIRCEYPLPEYARQLDGWQTKDTPAQTLDVYTIRKDGTLWGEEYDIEDRSDPNAEGILTLAGIRTRVNARPVLIDDFTGEIRFYTSMSDEDESPGKWVEFSAYFHKGELQQIHDVSDEAD